MQSEIEACYNHGVYYNPAYKHYNNITSNVTCDRCKTNHLSVCIGLGQTDLCMQCMAELSRDQRSFKPIFEPITPVIPVFPCPMRTRMAQGIFKPYDPAKDLFKDRDRLPTTNMAQGMFKNK